MRVNREKIAAAIALLLLVAGTYRMVLGVVAPGPGIQVPDVSLPTSSREVARPEVRRFEPKKAAERNPFSFSEGWRRLDTVPLDPPPLPAASRLVPRPERLSRVEGSGFIWIEERPAPESEGGGR